jgi:hypothetical protein
MPEQKQPLSKRISSTFGQAAARVGHAVKYAAAWTVMGIVTNGIYLTKSKKEKTRIREARRKTAAELQPHENENTEHMLQFEEQTRKKLEAAVTGNLFAHPSAGSTDSLPSLPQFIRRTSTWDEGSKTLPVVDALYAVSMMVRRELHDDEGKVDVRLTAGGDMIVNGKTYEKAAVREIQMCADYSTEQQAQALWNWTYKLAVSGRAPNLLPELLTLEAPLLGERGVLSVQPNDMYNNLAAGSGERASMPMSLWALDKNRAVTLKKFLSPG